jgi:glycosyltransferase involved in cell wall biosynthesis
MHTHRRTAYVVKVYPRFSETFIVTELLAREAAGEQLEIFALRPTTDTRFHPEIARVQAPVRFISKPHKLSEAWSAVARATAVIPDFAARSGALISELAQYDPADVHQAIELACEVVERGITHLHAHFGSLAGRTAELAALLAGIEYSVTLHAKDIFHESVDHQRLALTLERSHHVVTISEYNVAHLTAHFPAAADRIHLVYNGLELDRFPFRAPVQPAADAPLRIAAVGRLVEKKGFSDLITAVDRLRAVGTAVTLRIAGDGELAAELQRQVDRLGLHEHVTLLGARTQQEVRELLDWAHVFAAPSVVGADGNADGLPTVLLEAMATGVPCVASRVTGIPEAIIDGVTGLLHAPGDTAGLVAALRRAAAPDFDRRGIAEAARTLIESRFDSRNQARLLAGLEDGDSVTAPAPAPGPDRGALHGRRIAYVSVDPGVPVFGTKGASVHVQEVVREFIARGAEVAVFTTRSGHDVPADLVGVDVVHLPIAKGPSAQRERAQAEVSAQLAALIREDRFDLVYERYSLFSTALAEAAAAGVPGILEVNAPLIDEQRTHRELIDEASAQRALQQQVVAAARTVCVSEPVAQWVRQRVDGEVVVVPNGVNTDRIVPGEHTTAGRAPRIVFVGTLKPWHGVDVLVDALRLMREDCTVRIVGDGPQGESLRERVAEAGLGEQVSFTGAVTPEQIPHLLRDCDLAVAPYPAVAADDSYFSPLKVYEYLAAGLPVVASAIGQLPAILGGSQAGVLVEPSDPRALARVLDELAAAPARRRLMSAAARQLAESRHSWTAAVDRILAGVHLGAPSAAVAASGAHPHTGGDS